MNDKKYTGSCYIGVVGPTTDYGSCRDSIHNMVRRVGDIGPFFGRATKGYEARQKHFNKFMEGECSFLLLLDHDMIFPSDTLERLRAHELPYVSGMYPRRQIDPIAPVWFHDNPELEWPFKPYLDVAEKEKLHKIGASGWGCILIHREVIEATRAILKGEDEVIEDDMDVWPYDLEKIATAIKHLVTLRDQPNEMIEPTDFRYHVSVLESEFRVLRGKKDVVGSDIRFPFYAREAGYQLWLDADVSCGHMIHYPLTVDDYAGLGDEAIANLNEQMEEGIGEARLQTTFRLLSLGVQK